MIGPNPAYPTNENLPVLIPVALGDCRPWSHRRGYNAEEQNPCLLGSSHFVPEQWVG